MADPVDLDELDRLEKAATPGPWCSVDYARFCVVQAGHDYGDRDLFNETSINFPNSENFRWRENGKLAAAARNALPGLIRELREARKLLRDACMEGLVKINEVARIGHELANERDAALAELREARAKVGRLTARGIEDLRWENDKLRARVAELEKELDARRGRGVPTRRRLLIRAVVAEARVAELEGLIRSRCEQLCGRGQGSNKCVPWCIFEEAGLDEPEPKEKP